MTLLLCNLHNENIENIKFEFDTINHKLLLEKFYYIGIRGIVFLFVRIIFERQNYDD